MHRSFMVSCTVRLGQPNLVVALPTPEEKYERAKKKKGSVWVNPKPTASSPLTAESYCRLVLQEVAKAGAKVGSGRRRPRGQQVRLVHDRDSVHTSEAASAFASSHGIELIELPPRSPDLDPLDYGVFGGVKKAWYKQVSREQMSWDKQCQLLIKLLKEADASAAIKSLPGRIQKLIAAEGGRFEA